MLCDLCRPRDCMTFFLGPNYPHDYQGHVRTVFTTHP